MERLTGRRDGHAYIVGCPDFVLPKIAGLIIQQTVDRLATIEDILGDDYDLDHLRKLVQIDQLIGKDVWSADPFQDNKPRDGGVVGYEVYSDAVNLFVNFDPVPMTAYFSLEDIGKTVFMTREEAEEARRREQE